MLTYTDVHYLAAFLTQIASPRGVEIELGEMVYDKAAEKPRDVDITIRYRLQDGTVIELHGIEVKDKGRSMTVEHVEQIVSKLNDMPSLTKRGLVSSNGYTDGAKSKARHHNLELFHFQDWNGVGLPADLSKTKIDTTILGWDTINPKLIVDGMAPDGSAPEQVFNFGPDLMVNDPFHPEEQVKFGELLDQICNQILNDVSPCNPGDLLVVGGRRILIDKFIKFDIPLQIQDGGRIMTVSAIHVQGTAIEKVFSANRALKALTRDGDTVPMAACLVSEVPDGGLWVFMTSSNEGSLSARIISSTNRGKKKIYKERLTPLPF